MGRMRRGWKLFKVSFNVALKDRELIFLGVRSVLLGLVGAAAIWGLMFLIFGLKTSTGFFIVTSLFSYWWLGSVTAYYRGAQVAGARERLSGGDPTIKSSLVAAGNIRWGLVKWGLLTATVSFLLELIRAALRNETTGDIMSGVLGAVWKFITFLALPVVVFENVGPFKAVKRSAKLLKTTWGEQLTGGGISFLATIVAFIPAGIVLSVGVLLWTNVHVVPGIILISIASIYLVVVWLFWTLVTSAYQTALYMYATTGQEPGEFAGTELGKFFEPRKKGRGKKASV